MLRRFGEATDLHKIQEVRTDVYVSSSYLKMAISRGLSFLFAHNWAGKSVPAFIAFAMPQALRIAWLEV